MWKNSRMTSSAIRRSFLDYFAGQGHQIVRSSSLVPADDPTLLFTNAGMNQFKDLFLGRGRRACKRAATSQKCMRVSGKHNDLDNVGPSLRHHTFFEMLGNFSFGDYFKEDAIPFAWTLLTEVWELPPDRLHPTVFKGGAGIPRDEEAHAIWSRLVPPRRIVELGLEENFWAMGDTGPCGRCSEVHYHRGDHIPCGEPACRGIDCSCERYVEIWNNVFMEFNRDAGGSLAPLPAASIDTGMGLERIVAIVQQKASNYDTDLFAPLLHAIGGQTGRVYGPLAPGGAAGPDDVSMRVVADHLRAMTFLIADGVMPSNEWRGYVLRKIMRRAMRHGKKLGMTRPFLHRLVDVVADGMGDAYPELRAAQETITSVVRAEEDRFDAVLTDGLPRLESALSRADGGTLTGEEIFRLYDTYGLPLDFIEELAGERKATVDRSGFERRLESQRSQSRAKTRFGAAETVGFTFESDAGRASILAAPDRFEGYAATRVDGATVLGMFDEERTAVAALGTGASGYVVLDRTPFYLEAGGQVSDTGQMTAEGGAAVVEVDGVERIAPGAPRAHRAQVTRGCLRAGDRVTAGVNRNRRDAIRRNHTATHLLHAALREHLGAHVKQAGSLVAPDRLRFDFAHGGPVSPETLDAIEREVNAGVCANPPGGDRDPGDPGRHRGRRHGPVRREVRRLGAGGLGAGRQHGAVRRHPLPGHRGHRTVRGDPGDRRRRRRAPHRSGHRRGRRHPRADPAQGGRRRPRGPGGLRRPGGGHRQAVAGRGQTARPRARSVEDEDRARRVRGIAARRCGVHRRCPVHRPAGRRSRKGGAARSRRHAARPPGARRGAARLRERRQGRPDRLGEQGSHRPGARRQGGQGDRADRRRRGRRPPRFRRGGGGGNRPG